MSERIRVTAYARALSSRPTGRGKVALELLRSLSRLNACDIDVFSAQPVDIPGARFHATTGPGRWMNALRFAFGSAWEISRCEPDVLWSATHLLPVGLPRDLPKVITLHDVVWRDRPNTMDRFRRLLMPHLEASFDKAAAVVCVSEFTRSRLVAHWPQHSHKAVVLRLAPSTTVHGAQAAASLAFPTGVRPPFVVTVDTLEPRKCFETLRDAVAQVPGCQLIHCGPTGWNAKARTAEFASDPNVRLMGYVDDAVLQALYAKAAAAVFASCYEGFHLGPLEAAHSGSPVVVSDIPVHHEVLADGALYFPTHNSAALATHIRRLVSDSAFRAERVAQGKLRAACFSWDRSAQRLLEVLRNVATGRSPTDGLPPCCENTNPGC